MPIIKHEIYHNSHLALWKIEESEDVLEELAQLTNDETNQLNLFSFDKRRKEWLSVRALLNQISGKKQEIIYDENGKPALKNSPLHISITHSLNIVGILISNNEQIGIDIEKADRNVSRVIPRFLNDAEIEILRQNPPWLATVFWCCKEAVFKAVNKPGIEFKDTIFIFPKQIEEDNGLIDVIFRFNKMEKSFQLKYEMLIDYYIVSTIT